MPEPQGHYDGLQAALAPLIRQLDRLEDRTRDIVTRSDLENLRKELVARDSLEPELRGLKAQVERIDKDCQRDKEELGKRMDKLEAEQISKQDRMWLRLGQIAGLIALLLALFDFVSRLKFLP